jgi:hypothetical protein
MGDALALAGSGVAVLVLLAVPGLVAVRILRGSWLLALGLAPALGFAVVGISSLLAPAAGMRWSLLPWALASVFTAAAALALRRLGVVLPRTILVGRMMPARTVPGAPLWIFAAAAIAVLPIMHAAGWRPDAVLERWDTLYHLNALQWVRESGSASPLTLGSISTTQRTASMYPSAFHALVTLVPWIRVPVLLNGATLALATVPWVLGTALLCRAVLPRISWAPFAGAVLGLLIPGAPLDEWIHLSPIPNLTGFAALPGLLAAAAAIWRTLGQAPTVRASLATVLVLATGVVGLLMLHPNTSVMALLMLAALTGTRAAMRLRERPALLLVPVISLVPVAVLQFTPLGRMVTGFSGGLRVPWWIGVGEVVLGLHTVWPMALGVVIALLWWPGLVRCARIGPRWIVVGWVIVVVLYLDAAVDSPLDLSVLFYRGQDRLTMPLCMLSCVLAVSGLDAWTSRLGLRRRTEPSLALTGTITMLTVVAVIVTIASVSARAQNASSNLALDSPDRGRFLQADELAAWDRADPRMDHSKRVLADPFSGAAHMWALHGQSVEFAVAGTSLRHHDELVMQAAQVAGQDPTACAFLERWNIGYVYQDHLVYQFDEQYSALGGDLSGIGPRVFSTDHSRLYEVQCDVGDGDTDFTGTSRTSPGR